MRAREAKLLKRDTFGEVRLEWDESGAEIVRDAGAAPIWARGIARRLLAREAKALTALEGMPGVPQLLRAKRTFLVRSFIAGRPLQVARTRDPVFFRDAARLLHRLHRLGIVHNDLAKEPNVLVDDDGNPALIDFQLASVFPRRSRLFRVLAREDLRHLLKHKRTYCRDHLTARERGILEKPSIPSRLWAWTVKPAYNFVTRRVLGWADREGATDRTAL